MELSSVILERNVLSCLLKSRDAWLNSADILTSEDFTYPLNSELFNIFCGLHDRKAILDPVLITERLASATLKELDGLGGWGYLNDLRLLPIAPANVGLIAGQLHELTIRRRTKAAGERISVLATGERSIDQMLSRTQVEIDGISATEGEGVIRIGADLALNVQAKIENAAQVPGLSSGFQKLDMYLQGFQPGELYVLAARKKVGKALALDTPIATPGGWALFGDLRVGSQVFDETGKVVNVVGLTEVWYNRPCYRVIFSDCEEIIADAEHEWSVQCRRVKCAPEGQLHSRTTGELAEMIATRTCDRDVHRVRMSAPLELPDVELPIPPYTLGIWLGDGHSRAALITCGAEDERSILREVRSEGIPVRPRNQAMLFSLTDGKYARDSVQTRLRKAGLFGNKTIPGQYLRASYRQRLSLLQGLMDADGCVSKRGPAEFTTTSEILQRDVSELLATMGLKHRVRRGVAKLNGREIGPKWRILFTPSMPVFRIPRKLNRQRAVGLTARSRARQIVSVIPIASVPVRCIEVDSPSHLFLAGRKMVPTHNSVTLLTWARNLAIRQQKPILYLSTEHHHKLDQLRLLSMESEVPFNLLNSGMVKNQPAMMERVTEAVGRVEQAPFHFKYLPSFDLGKIKRMARKYIRLEGARAIFFDLIKMPQGQNQAKEWQELGALAYGLKELAGEEEVPLISAVQFNREAGSAQRLQEELDSDYFAGSDRIAQALTVAFALRRPYKDELKDLGFTEEGVRILQVTDNRLGPSGFKSILQFESSTLNLRELQRLA